MNEVLTALAALILKAQMDAATPGAREPRLVTTHVNGTVGLLAFDKAEFNGTTARGRQAAVALSGAGDVVGGILNRRGTALCEFAGYYDGECVVLEGCGASGVSC